MLCRLYSLAVIASCCLTGAASAEIVTWKDQAKRLQSINASFLDAVPVVDSIAADKALDLRATLSFLPKADPQVGAKTEDVPKAPFHTIPVIQWQHRPYKSGVALSYRAWAGYLLPGAESLLGLKAKLTQSLVGGAVGIESASENPYALFVGWQSSDATVKGHITTDESDDKFTAKTTLGFVAVNYAVTAWNSWVNYELINKSSKTTFHVGVDQTQFNIDDKLDDASPKFASQVAIGWRSSFGVKLALAELVVPKRVMMPRALAAYELNF